MSGKHPNLAKIYRAPNEKFYALWRGRAVCMSTGALRYFETEREARSFLTESAKRHLSVRPQMMGVISMCYRHPAKAGAQGNRRNRGALASRFRGNDE